jgi:hypothetical protein
MWRDGDGDAKYTKFKHFILNFQGTINSFVTAVTGNIILRRCKSKGTVEV